MPDLNAPYSYVKGMAKAPRGWWPKVMLSGMAKLPTPPHMVGQPKQKSKKDGTMGGKVVPVIRSRGR
jgi:hypothetical protein